jgi:hypothetical protein
MNNEFVWSSDLYVIGEHPVHFILNKQQSCFVNHRYNGVRYMVQENWALCNWFHIMPHTHSCFRTNEHELLYRIHMYFIGFMNNDDCDVDCAQYIKDKSCLKACLSGDLQANSYYRSFVYPDGFGTYAFTRECNCQLIDDFGPSDYELMVFDNGLL